MKLSADKLESLRVKHPRISATEFRGDVRAVVEKAELHAVLQTLRDELGFDLLVDVTCVDYLHYPDAADRFGLVYLLASTATNERIAVRVFVNDPEPAVASIVDLWEGADWLEREVWDLFGVRFEGHPDLRRLLLPEAFSAHPLRKDYPLQGRGERHHFPVLGRASEATAPGRRTGREAS